MDHSIAHVIKWSGDMFSTSEIRSEFTHEDKVQSMHKSENLMHNKEQQLLREYFGKLRDVIGDYPHVVLFGPTTAKTELLNFLKRDGHFEKCVFEVVHADKMTENQEQAFVREYFPQPVKKSQPMA
jgi:stalled ribosome rescue protein Dom34